MALSPSRGGLNTASTCATVVPARVRPRSSRSCSHLFVEEVVHMQSPRQAITVDFDVPAPMRDGTILRANIYRPAAEGRWPVLLTRLPYGKDLPLASAILDPVQAARRGYVVIVQDTRGRFASDGDWYPFRAEADDGIDTIAWAAELPFCDGR